MGYCQVGGSTQPCTPEDCSEVGGHHVDKPGDYPGGCFLLSVLGDERAILMTGSLIYPTLIAFRDRVLRRTPVGRTFVTYFDTFYEEAKAIARADPQLVTEIVWLTTYVSPFLQAMMGAVPFDDSVGATPVHILASEYRPGTHRAFVSVLNRFRSHGGKPFVAALNDVERTLDRFIGLTPQEALRLLRGGAGGAASPVGPKPRAAKQVGPKRLPRKPPDAHR
jgi:hypothetical protein